MIILDYQNEWKHRTVYDILMCYLLVYGPDRRGIHDCSLETSSSLKLNWEPWGLWLSFTSNHHYYIFCNESCALFLSRYTTVDKLQQSYLFIPNKYKVIVDLNWSTCIYFCKLLLSLYTAKTIIIVIIHCSQHLSSHWLKAYS